MLANLFVDGGVALGPSPDTAATAAHALRLSASPPCLSAVLNLYKAGDGFVADSMAPEQVRYAAATGRRGEDRVAVGGASALGNLRAYAAAIDWLARQPRFGGSLRGLEAQLSKTEALLARVREHVARFLPNIPEVPRLQAEAAEASDNVLSDDVLSDDVPLAAEYRRKWLMMHDQFEQRLETVAALGKAVATLADADERARVEAEDADAPRIDKDAVTEFQTVPLARRLERALANARRDALAPLIVQEYVEARAAATAAGDSAAAEAQSEAAAASEKKVASERVFQRATPMLGELSRLHGIHTWMEQLAAKDPSWADKCDQIFCLVHGTTRASGIGSVGVGATHPIPAHVRGGGQDFRGIPNK